ncbi:unnamed protein product [Urochloa decumbens]|uniref:F-box domain-containing protein n=1 Tax=Urochloa decumbens TaxID=240449 RepID=A0ABC9G8Q5_9POAL
MAASVLEGNKRPRPLPVTANDGMLLPTELLSEVLLRFPADELCRLRLVCRSWRSLTYDPVFTNAHTARHPLVAGVHGPSGEIRFMDLSGNVLKQIRVSEDCSCLHLSSQLDMVCISESRDGKEAHARVLNTATGAVTVLPGDVPAGHDNVDRVGACMFVLGHVPCTGELKVLRIHLRIGYDDIYASRGFLNLTCDIMTLVDNGDDDGGRWRVKPRPLYNVWSLNGDDAVVNEIAYFLIREDHHFDGYSTRIQPGTIASFDLAAEEWRSAMIKGPPSIYLYDIYDDEKIRLAGLDGCLVTVLHNDRDCSVDLWFLVDLDSCIWTKRYSLQCSYGLGHLHFSTPYPLLVLDDGRVVVEDESALKAYDTRTRTWEHLASVKDCLYVHKHEGSLLHSGSSKVGPA